METTSKLKGTNKNEAWTNYYIRAGGDTLSHLPFNENTLLQSRVGRPSFSKKKILEIGDVERSRR
jgi:hypothetical protein